MGELRYIDGSTLRHSIHEVADVVVIGSGAGGAPTAAALAEAGLKVVIFEDGPYVTGAQMNGHALDMFSRLYRRGGLTGTIGRPPIPVPLGRAVGGTTVVNSGTCFRTPDTVLQMWEQKFGLTGATDLDGCYREVEKELGIKPVPDPIYGEHARRFERASVEMGYKGQRIPRNEKGCVGTGVCALGCPQDAKQAMSVSYIPRALAAGAKLFCNAPVDQILIHRGSAFGVVGSFVRGEGIPTGTGFRVLAKWIVLAAGAMHSPAILLRSKPGIHQPRLGRNLHLHPATRVLAKYPDPINGWAEVPQSYNVDEFIQEGIFIQGQWVGPPLQAPNVPGFGKKHLERMEHFERMASFGALISDTSAGRVFANGLSYYKLSQADADKLRRAIAITTEIFLQSGAEEVYTGVRTQPLVRDREGLDDLRSERASPGEIEMMAFHPMGTCAAGKDGAQGVTDAWGRVWGIDNLAVADTSIFPTSNRINPQLTLMALAIRNARHWVKHGMIAGQGR